MHVRRIGMGLLVVAVLAAGAWYFQGTTRTPDPVSPAGPVIASSTYPPPTEHRLDRDAERRNKQDRRRWMEELHYAAPDVDWRAVERGNGERLQELRNRTVVERSDGRTDGWTERGSRNLAGRMHAAHLSATGDSLYGGSSRGGVWKGSLHGEGWRPIADNLWGGSHGVAVASGATETVTSITDGGNVHYSADGGLTWHVPAGIGTGITGAKRVLSDASSASRVYLLVAKGTQRELHRSDDGGASYTLAHALGALPGDIWIDRVNGGTVYMQRGSETLKSEDQGASWVELGRLPVSMTDVVLSGSEAGAPTLYAAAKFAAGDWRLYRSIDAGLTWEHRYDIHDFWETMAASITDPNLVLFGGVELWRSTDGGAAFTLVNSWVDYYGDPLKKLHADNPGLDVLWTQAGEVFYMATDGGLYRSDDGVATVTNISMEHLGVSQYYTTHTSVNDPDLILAGSQDQGYQRSTGPAGDGLRDFTQLISGDYGHLTSSDGTHSWVYSVYPGFILVQRNLPGSLIDAYLDFPEGESHSWMPYILADPRDQKAFYFCARGLHRYFKPASGTWQRHQETTQDFTVAGGSYLTAVSISPVDTHRRIAVTNTGVIWYSTDAGINWTLSPDTGPSSHYFYGTTLEPSPIDALTAVAGGSGYSGAGVYRTTDGGISWSPVSSGLPRTLFYDLAYESPTSDVLYAATESGPYRFDPVGGSWEYIGGTTAPLTTYWSVEAVPAAGVMRFGTYGRGIWDFDTGPETGVADAGDAALGNGAPRLVSFPNPFNASTSIAFDLPMTADVRLSVYSSGGRLVSTLRDGVMSPGPHDVRWDGRDATGSELPSGVYFVRLEVGEELAVHKMVLLK